MRRSAHARGPAVPVWIAPDATRPAVWTVLIQPTKSEGNSARLLFLERPTPCAWTYANNALEMSREMTLIAEAALRGYIGERQPAIAQLFFGLRDALLNEPLVRRHSHRATEGTRE